MIPPVLVNTITNIIRIAVVSNNVSGIVVSRYLVSISSVFGVCTSVASCELFGLWLQVVCLRELGISCARVFRFVVNFGRFRFRTSNSS